MAVKLYDSEKASDKSDESEISSHKSDKFSDDLSLPKEKFQASDNSDNSGSTTPEICLEIVLEVD